MTEKNKTISEVPESPDRRKFLANAGRFAVVTPAAVTVLLNTSMKADASIMSSTGDKYKDTSGGNGNGGNRRARRREFRMVVRSFFRDLFRRFG